MPCDIFNLARFTVAQDQVFADVLEELKAGQKRTHWMWFIFPQIAGLGRSEMARVYVIQSLDEAKAYLVHPVLGARLRECTTLVNQVQGRTALQIFGSPDEMKFCSCMTLFERASGRDSEFSAAINLYFGGNRDSATLDLLPKVQGN